MATLLDSATLERLFWLQCGKWIIIKAKSRRQPGHKILQQLKKKKIHEKKRIGIRNTDFRGGWLAQLVRQQCS